MLVDREVLDRHGLRYDPAFLESEDYDLWTRLFVFADGANLSEPLVEKRYGDSFEDTTLETVLSGLGVGRLVVVGAQTDACIRSTLHGAFVRATTRRSSATRSAWPTHRPPPTATAARRTPS